MDETVSVAHIWLRAEGTGSDNLGIRSGVMKMQGLQDWLQSS